MTEPYSEDLWNRHEHREEGHASQPATKQCVGVESMSRWGNRIWKHSRLPGQIFWLNAGRIVFYPQSLELIKFRINFRRNAGRSKSLECARLHDQQCVPRSGPRR